MDESIGTNAVAGAVPVVETHLVKVPACKSVQAGVLGAFQESRTRQIDGAQQDPEGEKSHTCSCNEVDMEWK